MEEIVYGKFLRRLARISGTEELPPTERDA